MSKDEYKDKFYVEAGERIREARLSKRMTVEELAAESFITSKFLYEIEHGRKGFSAYVLYNLSLSLKISPGYILMGEDYGSEDAMDKLNKLFDGIIDVINELR